MGQNVFQKMTEFFEKPADNSVKPVDNSVKPAEFQVFKFFLFLSWLNFVSTEFFRFLPIFFKFNGFATFRILKSR
jgi:hypothetical protein